MFSKFLSVLACLTLSISASASSPSSLEPSIGSYDYIGCWAEPLSGAVRALVGAFYADNTTTREQCSSNCVGAYQYWGLEYGRECYCSNQVSAGTLPAPETDCSFPCAGNANEICGAGNRLSVYNATTPIIPYVPTIGQYTFVGCQTEAAGGVRALQGHSVAAANMTNEFCASICTGFKMFGTEYSDECFCGDTLTPGSVAAPITDCNFQCAGNPLELCGAPLRLNIYSITSSSSSPSALIQTSSPSALSSSSYSSYSSSLLTSTWTSSTSALSSSRSSSSLSSPSASTQTSSPSGPLLSSSLLSSSKFSSKSTASSSISSYISVLTLSSSLTTLTTVPKIPSPIPTQSGMTTSTPSPSPSSALNTMPKISTSSDLVISSTLLSTSSTSRSTSSTNTPSSKISSTSNSLPKTSSSSNFVTSSSPLSATSTSRSTSFTAKAFSAESSHPSSPTTTSSRHPISTDGWKYIGCFQDVDGHQMKNIVRTNDMTLEYCLSAAEARLTAVPATTYHYVGVEYGRECYGATAAPSAPTSLIGRKACTMTCKGSERHGAVETCGGRMQYNLYASVTGNVFSISVPTMTLNR